MQMYQGHMTTFVENCNHGGIDDVIMGKNKPNFYTAVTSLIFKLERRIKAQIVGKYTHYIGIIPNFR